MVVVTCYPIIHIYIPDLTNSPTHNDCKWIGEQWTTKAQDHAQLTVTVTANEELINNERVNWLVGIEVNGLFGPTG
jgi:hypothetical protein